MTKKSRLELPILSNVNFIPKEGGPLTIIDPKLTIRNGQFIIRGILDKAQYLDHADIQEKLGFSDKNNAKTFADLGVIKGIESFGSSIEICPVDAFNIGYHNLSVSFVCYGYIEQAIAHRHDEETNKLNIIYFEGLKLEYEHVTEIFYERTIFQEALKIPMEFKRDYLETQINFYHNDIKISFKAAFINDSQQKLVGLHIDQKDELPLLVYQEIKFQLTCFLSFAYGNNIGIRKESFEKDKAYHTKMYSGSEITSKSYSNYIPINDIHFRGKNVMRDYLEAFNTYKFIDEHFALSEVILLFNQAKKASVASSIFLMIVAIEKLASKFVDSIFYRKREGFIIKKEIFDDLIKETKAKFKTDFESVKNDDLLNYNILFSKLGCINNKGDTDKNLHDLFEFSEIERDEELDSIFPQFRNLAIHKGEVELKEGKAHIKRERIERLLNDIIANIIQYKGIRYLKTVGGVNHISKMETFKVSYEDFGLKNS